MLEERLRRVPWWAWLALFLAAASLMPAVEASGYIRRVGFDTLIFMLLALGLNVVVGWGGLLDLGYIAFYGVGSYMYAIFDSDKFGFHLPTVVAIPAITIGGALVGLLVGLPSRRLSGDYLAIVTLFFLELFETVATNGNAIFGHDVTGGANGILRVDPLSSRGPLAERSAPGCLRRLVLLRRARRSFSSSSWRFASSTCPARDAPGGRCARTHSPPR